MNSIEQLLEAVRLSPDNIPLRLFLAHAYVDQQQYDEAKIHFQEILSKDSTLKEAKEGLANVFFQQKKYSSCIVVLEELDAQSSLNHELSLLLALSYLRDLDIQNAQKVYHTIITRNPSFTHEELDRTLRTRSTPSDDFDDDETDDDDYFMEKPSMNFSDVGGMSDVKREIDLKIIQPLNHQELYASYGKKIGGGILLYGPPGCGKTYLAQATAGEIDSNFMSIGLNDILDMWVGNSEKNLHDFFERARRNTPCVIFFDEIDALGASRSDMRNSSSRHLINQFLQELDGINANNDGVLIIGATNAPWHLDPAFRRPGRFDRIIFVPPPDDVAREEIFKLKLHGKPIESIDYRSLAKKTDGFSGADINAVIDLAIEEKLEESFKDGIPKPLSTKNLLGAANKRTASTSEWFRTAKNYALYANESGLYDSILTHLKIKK